NGIRLQAGKLSVWRQDLAIRKTDVLEGWRKRNVEIAEAFAFRRQHLDELILFGNQGGTGADRIAQPPPQRDSIRVRIFLRINALDLLPCGRQVGWQRR